MQKTRCIKKADLFVLNRKHCDKSRNAEQNLTKEENKFQTIAEEMDGVAFLSGKNSVLSYVSPAAEKMFGFIPDEMTGESLTGFLEEEKEIPETLAAINETYLNHRPSQILELRFRRKNGSMFWGEVHVTYSGNHGHHGRIVGVLHDITIRKRMEATMLFHNNILGKVDTCSIEELLQAILDKAKIYTESSVGFCCFLSNDLSENSLKILSESMSTLEGSSVEKKELIPLNQMEFFTEALRVQKTVIHNEYDTRGNQNEHNKNHGGPFRRTLVVPIITNDMITAIVGVGGKYSAYDDDDERIVNNLAGLANDIVIRKRTEQSGKNMAASLIQAQKMALLGKVVQRIGTRYSHLLDIIYDNVKTVLEEPPLHKSLAKNLKNILETASISSDMMSQLLAFARSGPVMPIIIDLNIWVEGMLLRLKKHLSEHISLVWIPDTQRTRLKMDPSQIDQLLAALFFNAKDAIGCIGQITIETRRVYIDHDDCEADHPCKVPGNYVLLSVTDNGIGIDKNDLPHIFEPFFTTKNDGDRVALGLGLSVAYGIAKQNHGTIDCQSELGKGSTINVYLRRYTGKDYWCEEENPPTALHLKETILLVEDEPDILNLYQRMLKKGGYAVLAVNTPDKAITMARKYKGEIDLLLTDIVLEEVNGCDLSKNLLDLCPNLKTLFMSFYQHDMIAPQGMFDDGVGFIQKPFLMNELTLKVHNLLNVEAVH